MNISESLKSAVQNLRRELKRVGYPSEVDYAKVAQGEPEAFLPLLHHAFVDYSLPLAKHLTEDCKAHLAGKTDSAFITTLYTVLRDDFAYRPPITADQFFKRASFAEKKTIMCIDLLQLVRERHKTLSETGGSTAAVRQSMSAVSSKLTSSTSKLADTSIAKLGSSSSSIPNTARSTAPTKSNIGPRRSLYIAPSSAKKEPVGVPSLTPLNRSHSLSTEELKPSKAKRSAPANDSKDGDSDSQANVSVSNGVRIVVEKHGSNAASRRSIAASASGDFKVPLRAVPRPAAKESQKKAAEPAATPAPTATDEADAENSAADRKDRRKTMFASYSSSLTNKLERARRGNARLSIISERKSIEPGELNVADKENEGGSENKGESNVSDVAGQRSAPLTSLSVTRKDGNVKSAGNVEKQHAATTIDTNNNKTKRAVDTKRRDQQPVVVTTIDKTVLETILARLELAETRLRFAERNIDTLLEAARLSHATPLAKSAPAVAAVELVQNDAIAQSTFSEGHDEVKDAKDSSALVETATKWAVAADAIANASSTLQNTDIDASTVPNHCVDIEASAQPLNDTDVPFMSEIVLGEAAADMAWRREIEADTL